jgi:diaminopimelate epimerase
MKKISFTKMVASGNDFIVCQLAGLSVSRLKEIALKVCNRKYGIGADGLLILEKSRIADIKMRIFNADGSEAEMCGNGVKCTALFLTANRKPQTANRNIETKAGIIESEINGNNVRIKLTDPKNIKLNIPIKINNRLLKVNFINTGVPHTVIFLEGLDKIDVFNLGRQIRYHHKFLPAGTNVDFVEVLGDNSIKVRTYERGVEDETLACGTGAVASSLIAYRLSLIAKSPASVLTKSGELLKVYFNKIDNRFKNVWLEGKVKRVYEGMYYVK